MGVYCDDATTDVTVYGNVFYNVAKGRAAMFSNAGQDLNIQNNLFIKCGSAMEVSSIWYTWGAKVHPEYGSIREQCFGPDGVYRVRMQQRLDIKSKPYSEKYPGLTDWLDPIPGTEDEYVGMRPRRNVLKNNIIISCKEELMLRGPHAQCETENNIVTETGSDLVQIRSSCPVLDIKPKLYEMTENFEKIPAEKIGLYMDEYRKKLD
jgi:hypothetical protein